MKALEWLKWANWLSCSQFGINPTLFFRAFRNAPFFVRDYLRFRSDYTGKLEWLPCLHDRNAEGGATRSEYFWQDLLVARMIFAAKPEKHADIGSRIDGFVAHLASFRAVEVFDIRPVTTTIPGVIFKQADLMQQVSDLAGNYDSVSCLHALEHFGLGRYGDAINTKGFEHGLDNIACLLKEGGIFYLSVPIGIERVEFNGLRVSDPRNVIILAERSSLRLSSLTLISQSGKVEGVKEKDLQFQLGELATQRYNLGVFTFVKSDTPQARNC